jgi:hypothetical protein
MTKLQLAVKREYFLAMKSGDKVEEYREANEYWEKKLHDLVDGILKPRTFDSVVITDGYPKGGDPERTLVFDWRGFTRKTITHPHFGPDPVEVFAIDVGRD